MVVVEPFLKHLRCQIYGFPRFGREAVAVIDTDNVIGLRIRAGVVVMIIG